MCRFSPLVWYFHGGTGKSVSLRFFSVHSSYNLASSGLRTFFHAPAWPSLMNDSPSSPFSCSILRISSSKFTDLFTLILSKLRWCRRLALSSALIFIPRKSAVLSITEGKSWKKQSYNKSDLNKIVTMGHGSFSVIDFAVLYKRFKVICYLQQ